MDHIDELAQAFARLPGVGPRQGKRFVFHLLAAAAQERAKLAELISKLGKDVRQCPECLRFYNEGSAVCNYCADSHRDDSQLLLIEKDQDLTAIERAGTYKGRYFVLGGVLTLTGKGAVREKELIKRVEKGLGAKTAEDGSPGAQGALREVVLALSATSEGEHTADHVRELLSPYRDQVKISILGRGLATGSELEYSDAETLRAALTNRKET